VGLRARVLWPPADGTPGVALHADNAAALVIEACEGHARALLTADADSNVERLLDALPSPAVLKVGTTARAHRVARRSSLACGLTARRSRGARNPYGTRHPRRSCGSRR
jgi:hypothetical protein